MESQNESFLSRIFVVTGFVLGYSKSIEAAKNRRGAKKTDLPRTAEALHPFELYRHVSNA
jgi:hypothetical protein